MGDAGGDAFVGHTALARAARTRAPQAALWAAGPFSTPPPGPGALMFVGFAAWLFPLRAWWFDRHRRAPDAGRMPA